MMDPIPDFDVDNADEPEEETGEVPGATSKTSILLLPPVQALIIYIGAAIIIGIWRQATKTDVFMVAFWAISGFTFLSPLVNVFRPNWWRNTGLYIISLLVFWLLMDPLMAPASTRQGMSIGEGGIVMLIPMMLPFIAVPVSGVIKVLVNTIRDSKKNPDPVIQDRSRKISWAIICSVASILASEITRSVFLYDEIMFIISKLFCLGCSITAAILSIIALQDSQSISGFKKTRNMGVVSLVLALGSFLFFL